MRKLVFEIERIKIKTVRLLFYLSHPIRGSPKAIPLWIYENNSHSGFAEGTPSSTIELMKTLDGCFFIYLYYNKNRYIMGKYIITINERTIEGKGVITLLKSLRNVVTIVPNGLEESLLDIKKGNVHFADDAQDLIRQCSK